MKYVILDRDGVINVESDAYIKSPEEWNAIEGSLDAIARLTKAGYTIVITTNQSGVARNYFDLAMLDKIHGKMMQQVEAAGGKINKIYFCPHGPNDDCMCRKPNPGMLLQMQRDFNIDLQTEHPPYVGDSLRDIEVALATGCKPFLVTSPDGDGEHTLTELSDEQKKQVVVTYNLAEAVDRILHE